MPIQTACLRKQKDSFFAIFWQNSCRPTPYYHTIIPPSLLINVLASFSLLKKGPKKIIKFPKMEICLFCESVRYGVHNELTATLLLERIFSSVRRKGARKKVLKNDQGGREVAKRTCHFGWRPLYLKSVIFTGSL